VYCRKLAVLISTSLLSTCRCLPQGLGCVRGLRMITQLCGTTRDMVPGRHARLLLALVAAAGACANAGSGFAHGDLVLSNFGGGTPERHMKSLQLVVGIGPLRTSTPQQRRRSHEYLHFVARLVTFAFLWQSYGAKGVKSGVINVGKAILAANISTQLAAQCLGLTSVRNRTITDLRIPSQWSLGFPRQQHVQILIQCSARAQQTSPPCLQKLPASSRHLA